MLNNINFTRSAILFAGIAALDYALDRRLGAALVMGAAAAVLYNVVAHSASLGGTSP